MPRIFSGPAIIAALLMAVPLHQSIAKTTHQHDSKYAGQEGRLIKSLSTEDIAELERGAGWGLAKAAELNGVPGPKHLLELKTELGLTQMQTQAIALSEQLRGYAATNPCDTIPTGDDATMWKRHNGCK